ncbi:protein of unknown function [Amycolatopsis xylanica]|uniref:DUF4397 domain-containing protein n=1 Tax=Amycolatopsis xylanica TaxID=589385 RepID=A0A1H2TLK3_9PSEU|nr:DUF4397 domain-containing protein [Amycolatopsis xylanica]SDW44700.1 protein of unknown function [Amycolatopsis xylanica]
MERFRRLAAVLLLAALPLTPSVAEAATGPGPSVGWIRVGHLSPKVPPVDIYVAAFGRQEKVVIRKAGYGAVTPYSSLNPGAYTLSMRPADAAASTPPALTATVSISAQTAYSLFVFANGPDGTLKGELITDDLTQPKAGSGRVRLVQGSAAIAPVTVNGPNGMVVAKDAAYGLATPYADVPQGRWPFQLTGGGTSAQASVDVRAGSVTTVLVTENPGGGLKTESLADGATMADPPKMGIETGGGGTAPGGYGGWLALASGVLLGLGWLTWRRATR